MKREGQLRNNDSRPVGIWIRVSTEDQARGESPEHHERRAHYYAESKGWRVVEVYHLEGVSGKTVAEHPEAKRMLADVKRGRIKSLIFSKLARLARNTRELLDFADYFRDAEADLVSLQEAIDTSTPAGRLFYTMIAAMAHWEREEIASRVAASVSVRAKMGKLLGGQAPYGYEIKDGTLVPHPNEAPVRKLMYELFAVHQRKKTVARMLNDKGYRTRSGANFSDTTVMRLIQEPIAKGKHRLNYTKSNGDGKSWSVKPESEWEYVDVEPIVSDELWNRCNAIIEGVKGKRKPAKKTLSLFSGIVVCECGNRMYVPSNSPKYTCYKCRNKVPTADLEAVFLEQLKGVFLSPKELTRQLDKADDTLVEKEELLTVKRRELEKLHKENERIYRLYVDDKLTPDDFAGLYTPLQARKRALEDAIAKAEAEIDYQRVNRVSVEEILKEAEPLYSRWPSLSKEERRRVVESITEKIIIGTGKEATISIQLAYLPSAENLTDRQRNFKGSSRRRA